MKYHTGQLFLLVLFNTIFFIGNTQTLVDENTKEPVPFAVVIPQDTLQSPVIADVYGKFKLEKDSITFVVSAIGYKTEQFIYTPDKTYNLTPEDYAIESVVVTARGKDPAIELMRKVIKNKPLNSIDHLDYYTCEVYNKWKIIPILPDSIVEEKNFRDLEFISESITERNYRKPGKTQRTVLGTKVAGTKSSEVAIIADQAQPFDIYKTNLLFFNKQYTNPVSSLSWTRYKFNIVDTIADGSDDIYVVDFVPRQKKGSGLLSGTLHISTNQYAIKNFRARNNDGLWQFEIEQTFDFINGHWFPAVLRSKMLSSVINKAKIKYIQESIIDKSTVRYNDTDDFKTNILTFDKEATKRDSTYWIESRPIQLTEKEERAYEYVDSLSTELKVETKLTKYSALIAKGKYSIGPVDADIVQLLKRNDYENFRTGIDLETNKRVSKKVALGAYAAYGFKDKAIKYGGRATLYFDSLQLNTLTVQYKNDIFEPGTGFNAYNTQSFLYRIRRSYGLSERFDDVKLVNIGSRHRLGHWTLGIEGNHRQLQPLYEYQYNGLDQFTDASIKLSAKWQKQRTIQFLDYYINFADSESPILQLDYEKGIKDVFNSEFDYGRLSLLGKKDLSHNLFGNFEIILKAGLVSEDVPLSLLFDSNGNNKDNQWWFTRGTFQTMDVYRFYSNKYLNLFVRDNLGRLYKSKYSAPEIILHQAYGLGELKDTSSHSLPVSDYQKGYFESGIHLENLARFSIYKIAYFGVGAGAYTTYGPYSSDRFMDNTTFKISTEFTF